MVSTCTAPLRRCVERQGQATIGRNPDQNHRDGRKTYWGDKIQNKRSDAVRILFGNVNSLGQSRLSEKMVHLEECIKKWM